MNAEDPDHTASESACTKKKTEKIPGLMVKVKQDLHMVTFRAFRKVTSGYVLSMFGIY